METEKGFKVVSRSMTSVVVSVSRVSYKLDEWVTHERDSGPLAVFVSEHAAESFAGGWNGHVYECEFVPYTGDQYGLWNPIDKFMSAEELPLYSTLAESVKLVKKTSFEPYMPRG